MHEIYFEYHCNPDALIYVLEEQLTGKDLCSFSVDNHNIHID